MNKSIDISDYKVLLIDDDFAYTTGQEVVLSAMGLNITTMNNPAEALEQLKTNFYDVILLDFFMPEMTGEEFLIRLREFNTDTIIILQTGYSGEKPQDEMLYQLNIQGYYNKAKPNEDLILMVLSAIKSAQLLREIKRREEEKQISKAKDLFFAEKIDAISGEINEKLMSIGGLAMAFETLVKESNMDDNAKNDFITRIGHMQNSASHIKEAVKALGLVSENEIIAGDILEKVAMLMKMYMIKNSAKLYIKPTEDFALINTYSGNIPYIICRLIQAEVENGEKEITVSSFEEDGKVVIDIPSSNQSNDRIEEVMKIEKLCDNVRIEFEDGKIKVIIDKVEK